MKGSISFAVGFIGLCLFGAVSFAIPFVLRTEIGFFIFLSCLAAVFAFVNVMLIGFYRMLRHLHETVLFPDDPRHYPQRGRGLYFTGYIGLLVIVVASVMIGALGSLTRFRILSPRDLAILGPFAFFVGCTFLGVMFGGVLMMLIDIFHKAFFRSTMNLADHDEDEPVDIALPHSERRRWKDQ